MYKVTLDEAKKRLPELIRAALHGETVLIAQDDDQAVQLIPVTRAQPIRKTTGTKGAVVSNDEFDSPPEDYDDIIQA
jgi:antitoxin (DNA-binding transcriptional repressor) of toxin-antitoxin stability system